MPKASFNPFLYVDFLAVYFGVPTESILPAWLPPRAAAHVICSAPDVINRMFTEQQACVVTLGRFIPSLRLIGFTSVLPFAQAKLYNLVLFLFHSLPIGLVRVFHSFSSHGDCPILSSDSTPVFMSAPLTQNSALTQHHVTTRGSYFTQLECVKCVYMPLVLIC